MPLVFPKRRFPAILSRGRVLVTPAVFAAGSFLCLDFSLTCAITQKNRRQDRRRYRAKTADLRKRATLRFSLPSPSSRGAARGELCSAGGQAKAYPTSDEAITQQTSASCLVGQPILAAAAFPAARPKIAATPNPMWGRLLTCGGLSIRLPQAPQKNRQFGASLHRRRNK
jgi:hypothetical protein